MIADLRSALAFLTRLPGGRHPDDGDGLVRAVPWFGVVGLLVGALGGGTFWVARELDVGVLLPAVAAITVTALATGAFHEDGLADSVDALVGGWTVEDRLAILKDSRHGTFGVLALVLVSLWKVGALVELDGRDGALALLVANTVGRSAAVGALRTFPSARTDGLGAAATRGLALGPAVAGVAVGVAVAVVSYRLDAIVVLVLAAVGTAAVGLWARARIGGVTGDLLGAVEQVVEVVVLTSVVALA